MTTTTGASMADVVDVEEPTDPDDNGPFVAYDGVQRWRDALSDFHAC